MTYVTPCNLLFVAQVLQDTKAIMRTAYCYLFELYQEAKMRVRLCLLCFALLLCVVDLLGVLSGSGSRGRVAGLFHPYRYDMTRHSAWCIGSSAILALFLHETSRKKNWNLQRVVHGSGQATRVRSGTGDPTHESLKTSRPDPTCEISKTS